MLYMIKCILENEINFLKKLTIFLILRLFILFCEGFADSCRNIFLSKIDPNVINDGIKNGSIFWNIITSNLFYIPFFILFVIIFYKKCKIYYVIFSDYIYLKRKINESENNENILKIKNYYIFQGGVLFLVFIWLFLMYVTAILDLTTLGIIFNLLYHLFYIGLLYLQKKKIKILKLIATQNKLVFI